MDGVSGSLEGVVSGALELKGSKERMAVGVVLLKKSLELDRLMAAEIARMLQVGTNIDVSV